MRSSLLACLVATFLTAASACRSAAPPINISNRPASVNGVPIETFPPTKPIEQMSWIIFDGKTNEDKDLQKLKDLKGKVVILDFWATYCPPCLEEIPYLKQVQQKYGKENLQVIGLHVGGKDDRPKVPEFYKKLQIDYPIATPEEALVRFIFGPNSDIPQTAIFDRKGRFIRKFIGFDNQKQQEMDKLIEEVVNLR